MPATVDARVGCGQATEQLPERALSVALGTGALLPLTALLVRGTLLPDGRLGVSEAAARALARAANAAERQAPVALASGAYTYTRSESFDLSTTIIDGRGFSALIPRRREAWIGADGSGRLRVTAGEPIFLGGGDRGAWEAAGSPALGAATSDRHFERGELHVPDLTSFPTNPDELYEVVRERAGAGDARNKSPTTTNIDRPARAVERADRAGRAERALARAT